MVAYAVFILLVMIMVWIVLLRFGLLSVVVGASIGDLLTELPITFDLSAWYAGPGLVTLLLILGTTTWAFRASLAGRPLFRDEILEAEASARPAP